MSEQPNFSSIEQWNVPSTRNSKSVRKEKATLPLIEFQKMEKKPVSSHYIIYLKFPLLNNIQNQLLVFLVISFYLHAQIENYTQSKNDHKNAKFPPDSQTLDLT